MNDPDHLQKNCQKLDCPLCFWPAHWIIQIIYKKVFGNSTVFFAHGRLIWMIQIIYTKVFRNLTVLFEFASKSAQNIVKTRSSWLNCALRDVYCVSIGHYEAVAVGN